MTASSGTPAASRRTQARGDATRARILDATLACIVEEGYARTTTVRVCERSGAARGSLLHQFATRAELMAAAVAHLFEALTSGYLEAFERIRAEAARSVGARVEAAGELLRAAYADPRVAAVLDIYAAGRTDPELMAALRPVAARHRRVVLEVAGELFPETLSSPRAKRRLLVAMDAVQGLAFRSVVHDDGAGDVLDGARELLVEALRDARAEAS